MRRVLFPERANWQQMHQEIGFDYYNLPSRDGSIYWSEGVARFLLDTLVDFSREKNLKIIPTCSYVDVMFRREKSFEDVAA